MINVPVYSDENGTPQVSIYVEDEDGSFRRTQSNPLRLLRDDIQGISISQGDMVSSAYDRHDRNWQSPTVTFHYGRPQSFYQFIRDKVAHNRFFVFTKPQLAGHISKFSLHELKLKNSTSQRKLAIFKEKYIEALQLWTEEAVEASRAKKAASHTDNNSVVSLERRDSQQVKALDSESTKLLQDDNIRHFRRADVQEHMVRSVVADRPSTSRSTVQGALAGSKQRKNLIQEFSLSQARQRTNSQPKEHNRHFYKRFIFTIE